MPAEVAPQEYWAVDLLLGMSKAGCEVMRRHLAEEHYPLAYLGYVVSVLSRPRKVKIRKPAHYLYRCITSKLLLDKFRRSQQPLAPPPAGAASHRATKSAPVPMSVPSEVVCTLAEVRTTMYDNPGPFARRGERAATFEEHVRRVYPNQGFTQEVRDGQPVLVLRPK